MTSPSPVRVTLPRGLTPDRAMQALADLPGKVLLQTAGDVAGRSLVSAAPRITVQWSRDAPRLAGPLEAFIPRSSDPLEILEALLPSRATGTGGAFRGGWIGYLGYEVGDLLENLTEPPSHQGLPSLWFGAYDWAVVWDPQGPPRLEGAPLPLGMARAGEATEGSARAPDQDRANDLMRRMEEVRHRLEAGAGAQRTEDTSMLPVGASPHASSTAPFAGVPLSRSDREGGSRQVMSSLGKERFQEGVRRIREYILAGDLFQANLTHMLDAPWTRGGWELYRRLRNQSPAPFGAYLDTGQGEVASISPESFLRLRGDQVETRPIKGTAPRGASAREDAELARKLRESAKDGAENVMIVDLLRNDLSRVCRAGSVHVPRLLELESHPSVHHLVSTVRGRLEEDVGAMDLLRATLPGGSITGAPKIRAMEVLRELEPVRRGVYTGALGLLEFSGDLTLSVAIRTATLRGGRAGYGVGGGITLASDPADEWEESLAKAAPFLQVLDHA